MVTENWVNIYIVWMDTLLLIISLMAFAIRYKHKFSKVSHATLALVSDIIEYKCWIRCRKTTKIGLGYIRFSTTINSAMDMDVHINVLADMDMDSRLQESYDFGFFKIEPSKSEIGIACFLLKKYLPIQNETPVIYHVVLQCLLLGEFQVWYWLFPDLQYKHVWKTAM